MSIKSRTCKLRFVFDHWQIGDFLGPYYADRTAVFSLTHADSSRPVRSALKAVNLLIERGSPQHFSPSRRKDYEILREEKKRRAEREVLLMNDLHGNTNIVDYQDHVFVDWEEDGCCGCDMLIRMELLSDLRKEITERKHFTEADVLKVGKDICNALILCHHKNIIHRDIKPENIFFNQDGNYKLGDFGISRIVDMAATVQASTLVYTPQYCAPEQESGRYDHRADIYSLGLVLYELSNGNCLPFARSTFATAEEILQRSQAEVLPAPRNASPDLAKVILKACAHKPEDRFPSAQAFLNALNHVQDGWASSPPPTIDERKYCGYCGKTLDPHTRKCVNPECPIGNPPGPSIPLYLIIALSIALLAALTLGIRFIFRSPGNDIFLTSRTNTEKMETAATCSHVWQPASCTAPGVCTLCGEIGTAAQGHLWKQATYSAPKTCQICGHTEGDTLGKVGDLIEFGHYEQDNNVLNGAEPIVWEILEIDGNNIFVISQYAIDCQRYHAKPVATTWESCSLRQWLNGTFYNAAFTLEEKESILTATVSADRNPQYNVNPGNSTQDKVYILSVPEVQYYFPQNRDRLYAATPYAVNQGAYVNVTTGGSWWWLRTPGDYSSMAASVNSDGSIDYDGGSVATTPGTVLPVMWINMDM